MSLTDPIGDMLVAIRNANQAGRAQVDVPASKLASAIVESLKQEGFIQNWRLLKEGTAQGTLRIYLKYLGKNRKPLLRHVKRVSKPGLRIYVQKSRVPKVLSGIGVAILSTPKGVLTDNQARQEGVGGEVLCYVW
ncbi:MAG: 30S ribosomal protein S8 [Candidatus Omnitrophica bacterium]|nr:30S ribosomal protein S8 [Candidatus Omnitrophota bacterium]